MKYYYFLTLLIISGCIADQESKTSISLDTSDLLYLNHFNTVDTNFWVGNDGINYAEIKEGLYYYESLDSTNRYNAPHFPIYTDQNFSVETSIVSPSNEDSIFFGLVIGEIGPSNDVIQLLINNVGEYKIEANNLLSSGSYRTSDDNEFKKIKILKKDITTYFFINDDVVFNYILDSLNKFRCGPVTSSAVWMDYIKIETESEQ